MGGLDTMLYLCKSCYDYIKQQGIVFDRGDPPAPDFSGADLISDNAWHEKDLSSIVPAGVSGCFLTVGIRSGFVNERIQIRQAGNNFGYNVLIQRTQVADQVINADGPVFLGPDLKIEYLLTVGPFAIKQITVKGWFF